MMNPLLAALETYDSPLDMTDLAAINNVTPTSLGDFVRGFVAAASRGETATGVPR